MAGPGDYLFGLLAQSKGLPSHALRATEAAEDIPEQGLSGLQEGLQARQNLQQYKLLNTQLGELFDDPSTIPYGLKSTNTVKDLMTIAPTMQNYIPAGFAQSVAQGYGANTGGGQPSSSVPPQAPPPQTPATPSPTPGATSLAAAGGAGPAGGSSAFAPGTPTSIQAPSQPQFQIPAGGISKTAFGLLEPAMKASQEERLAQQRLAQEHGQFEEGQGNENTRAQNSIDAENQRFSSGQLATQQDEFNKANVKQMSGFDALKQLSENLNKVPASQTGPWVGAVTRHAGSLASGASPALSSFNQIREGLIGNFAAALDPNGRQNQALLNQLEIMTPTAQDSAPARMNKLWAMHAMLSDSVNRNYQGYNAAAQATGGRITPPQIPSFQSLVSGRGQTPNPNVQAAIQWAQANPRDPRAAAVLAKAQANGGI